MGDMMHYRPSSDIFFGGDVSPCPPRDLRHSKERFTKQVHTWNALLLIIRCHEISASCFKRQLETLLFCLQP